MDLNNLPKPAPRRLVGVRVSGTPDTAQAQTIDSLSALPAPPVGEALPESEGYDVGHAISPEERDALHEAGYSDEDIDAIGEPDYDGEFDEMDIDLSHLDPVARAGAEYSRSVIRDLQKREQAVEANRLAREEYIAENFHTRECPLPTCDTAVRVPKGDDHGDVLGIGMSMRAAAELEDLLVEHLQSHSLGEWMAALQEAQEEAKKAQAAWTSQYVGGATPVPPAFEPPQAGIIPGAKNRSPEKQAAVDAMDARLGRAKTTSPEEAAVHDSRLREMRRQRRMREPTPYDLTPAWSPDLPGGTVGIKR